MLLRKLAGRGVKMRPEYAQVVVDIAVADLNQSFYYAIPEKYCEVLRLGQVVTIPFGRQRRKGFIVGFAKQPALDLDKIRPIIKLEGSESLFDQNMLRLLRWMASYYKSFLINTIKTAIPAGLVEGKVRTKKINYVKLNRSTGETGLLIKDLKKRAPQQSKVLDFILKADRDYTVVELAKILSLNRSTVYTMIKKGYLSYQENRKNRRPFLQVDQSLSSAFQPTQDQAKVIAAINAGIKNKQAEVFLLHGITGSGKTEVYLQVIAGVLKRGGGAIVLVPEISLTPMMIRRFYSRFGNQIAVLHSHLSPGERYDEWCRLKNGAARIAIGARSAVFAPIKELCLIIIDEEHENSYKQGENPYYHAREVALMRGKFEGLTVLLGSATPTLESYYRAKKGIFKYLNLPARVSQSSLPPVKIIDMREELKRGNTTIFSSELFAAIGQALEQKEQILIFLNRRGYASFVLCRECGHVIKCNNCDISLTYYAGANLLRCHYCNFSSKPPADCPACGGSSIREFGIGTERVAEELAKAFPGAVVDRMDVDTTGRKDSHRVILKRLEEGRTDILVGTQMIAKGHDYPNISLVGVITADTILNLPDFRATERTFQLLTQVAGRTGRGPKQGQVIIQSYNPEHYSIQAARNHDFIGFYRQEIGIREQLSYPPFSQLVNIIIKGRQEKPVIKGAMALGVFLKQYRQYLTTILGPSPAPLVRLRNNYRWQIILKFKDWGPRNFVLTEIKRVFLPEQSREVTYTIDVDPIKML